MSTADTVLDVRQFLADVGETCHITCYHLLYNGEVLNGESSLPKPRATLPVRGPGPLTKHAPAEYIELGAIDSITGDEVEFQMVEGALDHSPKPQWIDPVLLCDICCV